MTRRQFTGQRAANARAKQAAHSMPGRGWMPAYDPVFALGPFLQLPVYLPSGPGPNGLQLGYDKVAPQVPGLLVQPLCQMSASAPAFIPGSYQVPGQHATPSDAAIGSYDHQVVPTATPPPGSLRSISPTATPPAGSTSAGSWSGSGHDDESQEVVSARSGFTSDDMVDASSQVSNSGLDQVAQSAGSAARLPKCPPPPADCDWTPKLKPFTTKSGNSTCSKVTPGDATCLSGFENGLPHSSDSRVIDSEAANPTPEEVARAAAADCDSPVSRASKLAAAGLAFLPSLDVVVGSWWDSKDSFYEVTFDEDTTASCNVKTTRPGGAVRETKGLIRVGQVRGKSAGRIIWGSAFVLEIPIKDSDQLEWRSIRGGRDFTWIRHKDGQEPAKAIEEAPPSLEVISAQLGSAPLHPEAEEQRMPPSPSAAVDMPGCHRRVWRAVREGKQEAPKTPNQVASASCRRVTAKSGEWRVIDKKQSQ